MEALKAMKNVKQTMELLCVDVTAEITTLTRRVWPAILHNGLNDIPDEILSRILTFDAYTRDNVDNGRPVQLQLVSKRFQSITRTTPGCWSRVDEKTPPHRQRMFENLPVDMRISNLDNNTRILDEYRGRIRHLEVNFSRMHVKEQSLPSVRSLVLHGYRLIPDLSFPNLTSLTCPFIPPPRAFPFLTHCTLVLPVEYTCRYFGAKYRAEDVPDYEELAGFLSSTPTLQYVSFPIATDPDTMADYENLKPVPLPNLKYLQIKTNCLRGFFLEVLDCPNLEAMDVLLKTFYEEQTEQSKSGTMSSSTFKIPSVTHLTIRGATRPGRKFNADESLYICLFDIHRTFPRLCDLNIDGEYLIEGMMSGTRSYNVDISLDRLRSVYVYIPIADHPANWINLSLILRLYKKKGAQPRRLEIKGRPSNERGKKRFTIKDMEALFPTTTIQVDDCKWAPRQDSFAT